MAAAGNESVAADLVVERNLRESLLEEVHEKCGDVLGVELARVEGHLGGQVCWAEDRDAVNHNGLSRHCAFTVATAFGSQIDDHTSGPHLLDHLAGD